MCGVPIHRADEYLQRLIRQGYRVAVCEQLEDPAEARKRGAKAVVKRDVVRLVTPGTITEEALLDAKARNYLTALFVHDGSRGRPRAVARLGRYFDGRVRNRRGGVGDLPGELVRLAPTEVLVADNVTSDRRSDEVDRDCGWQGDAGARSVLRQLAGERRTEGRARRGGTGRLRRRSSVPSLPLPARCSSTSI